MIALATCLGASVVIFCLLIKAKETCDPVIFHSGGTILFVLMIASIVLIRILTEKRLQKQGEKLIKLGIFTALCLIVGPWAVVLAVFLYTMTITPLFWYSVVGASLISLPVASLNNAGKITADDDRIESAAAVVE